MKNRTAIQIEHTLTMHCGRAVKLIDRPDGTISIILEPTGDRGRVELLATGGGGQWMLSDRGAMMSLYGLDLDFVIPKLVQFEISVTRLGDQIVTRTHDQSLSEAIAEFVEIIEFIPVLAGLFANELAA